MFDLADPGAEPLVLTTAPGASGSARPTVVIGDIACTTTRVHTPAGQAPIASVTWRVVDTTGLRRRRWPFAAQRTAAVAGDLAVTVRAPGWEHTTTVTVRSMAQITEVYARVLRARGLATQG